jgi:hypothetical protein
MVAGLTLGSLFMLSGLRIREGMSYGYEGATGRPIWNYIHACIDAKLQRHSPGTSVALAGAMVP